MAPLSDSFPVGWIILNVMFLYQLTVQRGLFEVLRNSLSTLAPDPRVQVILIAFAFGAFIEGVAGFGTPVAITGAILIQLGFKPLHASGLALIANTAPCRFRFTRNSHHHAGTSYGLERAETLRDGRSATALLLPDYSILGDSSFLRLARHAGCLAGRIDRWTCLCHPSICCIQLSRTMAGGYDLRGLRDSRSGGPPKILETKTHGGGFKRPNCRPAKKRK